MPDPTPFPPPCVHSPDGRTLCESCQRDYDTDGAAYLEFGDHPAGRARWAAFEAEMQSDMDRDRAEEAQDATPPVAWDEIPF